MTQITPPGLTIPDVISGYAWRQPNREALVCGETRLGWAELVARIHRAANALIARGLRKGDKVALLTRSSAEMAILIMATAKAGGVVVPLSPLADAGAIRRMIERAEVRFLFATGDNLAKFEESGATVRDRIAIGFEAEGWEGFEDFLAGASDADPRVPLALEDDFNIMYTSGTTGDPKGAVHSHFSRLLYPLGWGEAVGIDRNSTVVLTTPLYHNGTWITMLPALHHGGRLVIMERFEAGEFLRLVEAERCTHGFLVPTQLIVTLEREDFDSFDTSSLAVLLTGGSPLPSTTFEEVRRRFPHSALHEIYGMSEGFATMIGPDDYARGKAGTVGRPMHFLNTDVRLIDADDREVGPGEIGEVVGSSALLMKGYYKDPERTAETLWHDATGRAYLRSGDLGRIDEDGYLSIVGRSKDMIISGGVNIFPVDIEEVFMTHDAVSEVAVIGVPDAKWGETPLLLALMREGAEIGEEELMAWGNARLGRHQRVAGVEFRESFPRNAFDKIMKRELREPYWRGRESDIV